MKGDPTPQSLPSDDRVDHDGCHTLALKFDQFAWEALTEQAAKLETSVDELAAFSVLYYLADLDSKRIARMIPPSSRPSSEQQ